MKQVEIVSIEDYNEEDTYDIWNYDEDCQDTDGGNYFIDGILSHNSIPEAVKNRNDKTKAWVKKLHNIHPILADILKDTYGIILWQEQLAAIWQRLGGFTSPEAQEARKAVAKKHTHKLKDIGKKWLAGATPNIGKDNAEVLWESMVSFGRYAFNKCLCASTPLMDERTGVSKTVEEWYALGQFPEMYSFNDDKVFIDKCVDIHYSGEQEVFEVVFDNGQIECVTLNHKFLCEDGEFYELREIIDKGLDVTEAKFSRCK